MKGIAVPTLLSINNYYYPRGGAEVVFLEQNRLLSRAGWDVVPFCMNHPKNLATPWSKYFVTELEFGHAYSFSEKLKRVPKAIYSVESRWKINDLINSLRPDISHAHNIYHHISPTILEVLKKRKIPTVLTLHDLKVACPAYSMLTHDGICKRCKHGKLYNVFLHRCIKNSAALSAIVMVESVLHRLLGTYQRHVDRLVVPSRFYREEIIEWGYNPEKIVHIPNFVDVDSLQPQYRPGNSFLYFGRLSREKGLETLVKATAAAGVRVRIAGAGPQEASLRRLADKCGAQVTFLGYLSGNALQEEVRCARATVLPSEWYENAPISLMESYALGTPVIGAAIGGIPELIQEGKTGITFESGSVEGLAAAFRKIAELPDSYLADMGLQGRRWMESGYTTERYRERLLNLYSDIGLCV